MPPEGCQGPGGHGQGPSVLASWGCQNKGPETGWLKATEIHCLPVLEARCEIKVQKGLWDPQGRMLPCLFWLLVVAGGPRPPWIRGRTPGHCSLASARTQHSSLVSHSRRLPPWLLFLQGCQSRYIRGPPDSRMSSS